MCGIAGILAGISPPDEHSLREMTGALAARGPDGEGFHVAGPVALGHRRLAVIDVAGGHQPLHSEDGQVTAVVNGELYNFRELRELLERKGHAFATRADTEVLVHGYEEWGDAVLDRMEGMFAFALWDARRQRLLLARDRLGEKPLYWATLPGGGFAFASTLSALGRAPGLDARIDPAALARYLVYECVPAPATILRGARKLEPGWRLAVRPGEPPALSSYWDFSFREDDPLTDADAAAGALLGELRRSVRARLVSDVPLGVFLSGGVDSSTVAALAAEARGGDLDTFSLGFDDPEFDESDAARRVARFIGSRHHEERLTAASVTDELTSTGRLLDEPLGDASLVPTHLLARFARRRVTVALGGDGGDELFAGYQTLQAEPAAALLFDRFPPLGRAAAAAARIAVKVIPSSGGYLPLEFKLERFFRAAGLPAAHRHPAWMASFLPAAALQVLRPEVRAEAGPNLSENLFDVVERRLASCPARSPGNRLLYHYAKGYLADDVLTKVDRATMATGLEARSPFLAPGVVALGCRLGARLRRRGWETKYVLRRAMAGLLPEETLRRPKQGFAMPIGRWLRGPLRPWLQDTLSEARLQGGGLFDPAPVRRLVREHLDGTRDHRKPLWTLLAFAMWHGARPDLGQS